MSQDAAQLSIQGDLTFATAAAAWPRLRQQLAGRRLQALDLSQLGACDSAGLACVLAVLAEAQRHSGEAVQLRQVPAGLRALAEVAGLGKLFG